MPSNKYTKNKKYKKGGLRNLFKNNTNVSSTENKPLLDKAENIGVSNKTSIFGKLRESSNKVLGNLRESSNKVLGNLRDSSNKVLGKLRKSSNKDNNPAANNIPGPDTGAEASPNTVVGDEAAASSESGANTGSESESGPNSEAVNPTSTSGLPDSTKEKKENNPIDTMFAQLYIMIAYLCVILFILLFVTSVIDIVLYVIDSSNQSKNLFMDPNMFNKDTHDYHAIYYVKTNSIVDEPYHVFLCEGFNATIFVLVGICITMIGLEYGISYFLIFNNWYNDGNKDYSVDLTKSMKYFVLIAIALIGASVLAAIYKSVFINDTQITMLNAQQTMYSIKDTMYENLTTDTIFLSALTKNDIPTIIHQFSIVLKEGIQKGDISDAQKMVFTLSIHSYLTTTIPQTDPNYSDVLSIFEYDNIINATLDPTLYLYYKNNNVNIQNLYPYLIEIIKNGVTNYQGTSITADSAEFIKDDTIDPFFGKEHDLLKARFTSGIQSNLSTIIESVTKLSVDSIQDGKNKLLKYLLLQGFATFIFIILLFIALYGLNLIPEKIITTFISVCKIIGKNINAFFKYIIYLVTRYTKGTPF